MATRILGTNIDAVGWLVKGFGMVAASLGDKKLVNPFVNKLFPTTGLINEVIDVGTTFASGWAASEAGGAIADALHMHGPNVKADLMEGAGILSAGKLVSILIPAYTLDPRIDTSLFAGLLVGAKKKALPAGTVTSPSAASPSSSPYGTRVGNPQLTIAEF